MRSPLLEIDALLDEARSMLTRTTRRGGESTEKDRHRRVDLSVVILSLSVAIFSNPRST
ncbi:hypothetical protein QJS10_CPA02g01388 [Acorus calamus]|uniref:Uncharacterized protein n=1 Tax=Acorus calamus TaxID=4465 RepID=A0AAV9FD59_ACOCL|nr:hypothetical protein QJS10_CPA02g01388 [Acorus calamus]